MALNFIFFAKLLTKATWYVHNQQTFFFLFGLILLSTKTSAGEQKTLTAFSKLLIVNAKPFKSAFY